MKTNNKLVFLRPTKAVTCPNLMVPLYKDKVLYHKFLILWYNIIRSKWSTINKEVHMDNKQQPVAHNKEQLLQTKDFLEKELKEKLTIINRESYYASSLEQSLIHVNKLIADLEKENNKDVN